MHGAGSSRGVTKRKIEDEEKGLITLRVSNLPNPFMKQSLLSLLSRSVSPRPAKGDLREVCNSYSPQSNSVMITVKDIALADSLTEKSIRWYKKLLEIERVQLFAEKEKDLKDADEENDDEIPEIQPASDLVKVSGISSANNSSSSNTDNENAIANEDMPYESAFNYEVDGTSYSRYVKISGIPAPFEKLLFLPFIEEERRKAGIDIILKNSVVSCSDYDADDMSVTVEFLTYEQAQKFCELPIYFLKRYKLQCRQVEHLIEASALVKVSGISSPFVKELFLLFLEAEIQDAKLIKDNETAIINCSEYNADEKSVILELLSAKLASDFCKLTPISFICDTLKLESYVASTPANNSSSSNSDKENAIANEDMPYESAFNDEVDGTSYSRYVKISGIPAPFEKLLFLPFIEAERRKANIDIILKNAVVSCSDYDADDMSVTVEFLTYEQAQKFCELPIYFLKRYKLQCRQVEHLIEASALVKVSGISSPFVKELFLLFLEAEIQDAKLIKDNETAIIHCSEYNADEKSVILELLSAKLASDFCKLTPISFICDTLNLESYVASTPANNSNSTSACLSTAYNAGTSTGASTSSANYPSTSSIMSPSTSLPTLELSSVVRSDWSTHTQLVLLKFMIENRNLLLSTANRKKGEGFQNVMSGMKHFNLTYSENCVRRRMKALVTHPPPEAKTAVQEYMGEVPMGSSQIDELIKAHPDTPKVKLSLSKARRMEAGFIVVLDDYNCKDNGNLFPGDAETCLIQAYIKLKPKFDDDKTRSSLVYSQMLEIMHKEGYTHLKVDDLSTRMGGLANDFKLRYDSLLNRTGSGTSPTNWPHYDLLSQLYENSVIIEPQKIRSFGSSFANFSRDVRPFTKKSSSPAKPTVSKFLNARHDAKLEIQKGVLAEMKRQNDLNELRLQKDA